MGSLVWFRSDLRIADNPALNATVTGARGPVTALFVETLEQWRRHDWGPPKTDFVRRSVAALGRALAGLGIPLRLETCPSFAEVPATLLRVAGECGSASVHVNAELEVNERRRDAAVAALLAEHGIAWRAHHDQTVVPPGELTTGAARAYTVFTPFFRAWVDALEAGGLERPLPAPRPQGAPVSEVEVELAADAGLAALRELWPAGEAEARRRLRGFLSGPARRYHLDRDDPNRAATSALSPYLAVGAVSARTALWAGVEANGGELVGGRKGVAAWLRQLSWRDFYRHVLAAYPRVSMSRPFRRDADALVWRDDPEALAAWQEGRTGFPIVDAAMRTLDATGWMHNRLRMIVASFLTKDLLVDWREGERHFMNRLVDADLANNNGGWQWAASTGTDAVPYFRVFNPWKQSQRFDPEGRYIKRWLPELAGVPASALHDPVRLAAARPSSVPPPIVDHAAARQRVLAAFRAL